MSAILNLTEAKAKFSEVVERVSRGEETVVTRMGRPRRCRSHGTSQGPRTVAWGLFANRIRIAEDFDVCP